jgi:phage-related protein
MKKKRQLIYFKNYYWDFFNSQTEKVKDKIDYVLFLVIVADKIPGKFFDKIEGYEGLFEIKIEFESNIFRIFCCFDEGNIVVLFNAFQKKTQKTPKKEIEKALMIREEYFEQKRKGGKNEKHSNI